MTNCMNLMHPPKIVQIGWGNHVNFCVWKKNRPLLLAKGLCLVNDGCALAFDSAARQYPWKTVVLIWLNLIMQIKLASIILPISHTQTINKHEAIHNPERSANSVGNIIVRSVNIRTVHTGKIIHKYILSTRNLTKNKHQYYIDGSLTMVLARLLLSHWIYQSYTKPVVWWRVNNSSNGWITVSYWDFDYSSEQHDI